MSDSRTNGSFVSDLISESIDPSPKKNRYERFVRDYGIVSSSSEELTRNEHIDYREPILSESIDSSTSH